MCDFLEVPEVPQGGAISPLSAVSVLHLSLLLFECLSLFANPLFFSLFFPFSLSVAFSNLFSPAALGLREKTATSRRV